MKKLSALLLAVFLLAGCGSAQAAYRQITQEEAAEIMESDSTALILDVRTPEEFAQGHIPGAINLPNETIGSKAPAQLSDRNQTLLVYCRSGNRSKQASQKLADLGYTAVLEFGGINKWTGPVVP